MQALMVIMGIHSLVAAFDRRPAHTLNARIFQKLNEEDFCNSTFRGNTFNWQEPTLFQADVTSDRAQIEELKYTNKGSVGRTPEGYHVYRLALQSTIKDLGTNEVIRFPSRFERLVEVDTRNRIVACHPEMNVHNLASNNLQEFRSEKCEKPGWTRRLMCDKGSDRCYPMTLCERGS